MTTKGLNPFERKTSVAYRVIQSALEDLQARATALEAAPAIVLAGQVTLTASTTTTTVTNALIAASDIVSGLVPTTANAAASVTAVYVSSVTTGEFVLTHDSTAATDRTFNWLVTRPAS